MKKYVLIILMVLALQGVSNAFEGDMMLDPMYSTLDLEGEYHYFKSSQEASLNSPDKNSVMSDYEYGFAHSDGGKYKKLKKGDLPLFKRCRLIITNKVRQLIPAEKPVQYDEYGEIIESEDEEVNVSDNSQKSTVEKLKFWKKRKNVPAQNENNGEVLAENGSIADSIQTETFMPKTEDAISLETGISTHVTEKELMLDADDVSFDEDTGDMVATGRPLLYLPPQRTKVVADKMVYNQDSNILKGIGDVVVTKDGTPTKSDYIEIDMNEEALYMDNVESFTNMMTIDAEKAVQQNDKLILTNGKIYSEDSQIYRMASRMVGPRFSNMVIDEEDQSLFFGDPTGNRLNFDVDKIYIDAGKNHDKFTAKNIRVHRKGKYWFTWPSLTAYTDKDRRYFEANYPEFGTKRKLGMFAGPGFTFGGPAGSVVKVIPFINYQHGNFGFGGALKYINKFNHTELGYGSASDIFFLKGLQRLDDDLFLQYSANTYNDEWFLGSRMPKYMVDLFYDKSFKYPNFLAEGRDMTFRHRASFGLMEDNDRNYYGEKLKSNGTTTTRLRYMAQIAQTLYKYENPEKRFYFNFSWVLQGSAAYYGTGDTQFIAKTGPRAHVQYKNWMQDIGYYQAGYDDHTPVPRYDKYRYGHSSLYLTEIFRIHKCLSIGWSGMVNLSDDAPNGKLFQENRFVLAIGPDDLKIRLGYDFVRRTTYFGFDVAFDRKGTTVNYGKMEIKNPERLGKSQTPERKLSFTPAAKSESNQNEPAISFLKRNNQKPKVEVLEYAKVIDIEDPDKETVD